MDLQPLYQAVLDGNLKGVEEHVSKALDADVPAEKILNQALISAMNEVGDRFEKGDFFVPEMLVAARAMKAGIEILKPSLTAAGVEPVGKVVIGTVSGDLHDIGKNLVGLMLEGAGFEIVDVGTDVSADDFIEAIKREKPQILGLSALLTTTMNNAAAVMQALNESGMRDLVKVMIGGAPVTQGFADEIGADGYAEDAPAAAKKALSLLHPTD